MKLFLQKIAKFSSAFHFQVSKFLSLLPTPQPPAAGGYAPRPPLAIGSWALHPQTPQTAPHCEFLATRLGGHE